MIFTEFRFLFFFVAVFVVYWTLTSLPARKLWLLIASYTFYGAWDWRFLSLIVLSTLVDYCAGLQMAKDRPAGGRRFWLIASLVTNLGMLGFFKYFGFFLDSTESFLDFLGLSLSRPSLTVILPVGISFFTFQTMSYSIDVYRRRLQATRSLLDLALFVAFFPQLVAGPIVRAAAFLPQLRRPAMLSRVHFRPLLGLFLVGFIKKACISDNVATAVDPYFADPAQFTAAAAWLAILLYAVQIYCDFSGYSDMAIACAGLLGFELGLNFDAPYLARNLRQFWRRWHISLSSWLRDYLYIPLGGSRGSGLFTARNILLTMALGGLWHGAAWRFIVWGLIHGGGLLVHRQLFGTRDGESSGVVRWASTALTFYWTCLAWIFFRAPSMSDALQICRSYLFFDSPGSTTIDPAWWLLLAALAVAQIVARRIPRWYATVPAWSFSLGYGATVATALLFVRFEAQPFIYFQF